MAHSVRSTWTLGVTALSLAALLSADDLARLAARQPIGPARTLALAAVRPVTRLSAALWLDRPARWLAPRLHPVSLPPEVQPAHVARPLRLDVAFATPHGPSVTAASARPHRLRAPTPARPWVIWVGGDSQAQRIGEELVTLAVATGQIRASHDAQHATGLARPDYFNWNTRFALVQRLRHPDVMVVTLGTNDSDALPCGAGHCEPDSPGWSDAYRARVDEAMAGLAGVPLVVWLTLPPMRPPAFARRTERINAVFRAAAPAHPNVRLLEVAPEITHPDGAYTDFVTGARGESVLVREVDGIHVAREGARRIARRVLSALVEALPPEQPRRE